MLPALAPDGGGEKIALLGSDLDVYTPTVAAIYMLFTH